MYADRGAVIDAGRIGISLELRAPGGGAEPPRGRARQGVLGDDGIGRGGGQRNGGPGNGEQRDGGQRGGGHCGGDESEAEVERTKHEDPPARRRAAAAREGSAISAMAETNDFEIDGQASASRFEGGRASRFAAGSARSCSRPDPARTRSRWSRASWGRPPA